MNDLIVIEHNNKRVLTTKQLAEAYETDINNIKVNFSRNGDRFEEGKHYFLLRGNALKEFKNKVTDSNVVGKNANQLYLWTERGALRHAKILDTDRAWEVYEKLEETYFRAKQLTQSFQELSPQLQVLINLELKQKQLEQEIAATKNQVTEIKETIVNREEDWRKDVVRKLRKIGFKHGDYKKFIDMSYKMLEERAGCNLNTRLENLKKRMALQGATKTAIDNANFLDAIQNDKRLKEIYINIVNQLYIKYVA